MEVNQRGSGSQLASLLRHVTANRQDEPSWTSLAVPGWLVGSLEVFSEWSAILSCAMVAIWD